VVKVGNLAQLAAAAVSEEALALYPFPARLRPCGVPKDGTAQHKEQS
jgi:hypothetical protein